MRIGERVELHPGSACVSCGRPVYAVGGDCKACCEWLVRAHLWLARRRHAFLFGDRDRRCGRRG